METKELEKIVQEMQERNNNLIDFLVKGTSITIKDDNDTLIKAIHRIVKLLQNSNIKNKERSITITKLQEAAMCLGKD